MVRLRARPTLAVLSLLVGCHPQGENPPPPVGTPYQRYLHPTPAPGRPAGTGEGEAMRLHVIDVGQGTAALVELPCGAILVDTGGEQNDRFDGVAALTGYLDAFFARRRDLGRRLDLLVISHPHLDRTRGIAAVLARYTVANVIDNGDVREEPGGLEQLALHAWLARHRKIHHLDVAADDIDDAGLTSSVIDPIGTCDGSSIDPIVRVLWGGPLGREELGHDPNDDSIVVRVDFGEASLLLAGDLEGLGIARLLKKFAGRPDLLDADVFLIPHHGSKHSTAQALDLRVSPEVALISAGPFARQLGTPKEFTARSFGHPSRDALNDLVRSGVTGKRPAPVRVMAGVRGAWKETPSEFEPLTVERAIYATSWDGTIVLTAWQNGWLEVATEHAPPPLPAVLPPAVTPPPGGETTPASAAAAPRAAAPAGAAAR